MTACDYIRELKEKYPFPLLDGELPESLLKAVRFGHIPEKDLSQLGVAMQTADPTDRLNKAIREVVPQGIRELFERGEIAFGVIHDSTPDIHCESFDDGGYAIVFRLGLIQLIYRIARVLATRVAFKNEPRNERPDLRETIRQIVENFTWLVESGTPFGPSYEIEPSQIFFANDVAMHAELFLIAHEVGHVIIDMAPDDVVDRITQEDRGGKTEEHLADLLGMDMVLEKVFDKTLPPTEGQLRYAGIEIGLLIWACLAEVGVKFESSHPDALIRVNYIRQALHYRLGSHGDFEHLTEISQFFQGVFSEVVKAVGDQKYARYVREESQGLIEKLDRLLEQCSNESIPDYARFYQDAAPIFAKGYPDEILKKVGEIYSCALQAAVKSHGANEGPTNLEMKSFLKMKLLLGFMDGLTEPGRSVFLKAFAT